MYLVSAAQMDSTDVSAYCLNSDPVSEFVDQIRHQDEGAVSLTGMLAAGLRLLAGLGGGFGGGGGGGQARDLSSLSVTATEAGNSVASVRQNAADNRSYLEIDEGIYDDVDELDTGIRISATNSRGEAVSNLRVNDDRFEVRDGTLFIREGAEFDHEDDTLEEIDIQTSVFSRARQEQALRLTLTGDGGFQRELDIVIRDADDYPVSLSLSAETGVADNTAMSVQRVLATIDVDEGEDEQDGGEIEITSISRPDGVSVSDAEDLVEIAGTTLRLVGDIDPDDMPDGTYVFEISYGPGDDELIGEAPEPVTFTLTVGDINEQPTDVTITTQTGYVHENDPANNAASIEENTDTTGGLFLARLRWRDTDTGQDVTNRNVLSVPNNDYFEIRNDDELWLRADVDLNHEEDDRLEVVITVEDDTAELGTPATQRFILHITDVNEQPTEFSAPLDTEVAENRRGEDEIKLADITVQDQDRVPGHRDNVVTITGVVDDMGIAISDFADLFEIREDGDQWDLFLTDPSQIDFEAVQERIFCPVMPVMTGCRAGPAWMR